MLRQSQFLANVAVRRPKDPASWSKSFNKRARKSICKRLLCRVRLTFCTPMYNTDALGWCCWAPYSGTQRSSPTPSTWLYQERKIWKESVGSSKHMCHHPMIELINEHSSINNSCGWRAMNPDVWKPQTPASLTSDGRKTLIICGNCICSNGLRIWGGNGCSRWETACIIAPSLILIFALKLLTHCISEL